MAKDFLYTGEVAEILGLQPRTVSQWAKQGRLVTIRWGGEGYYRYPADQIMEMKRRWSEVAIDFEHPVLGTGEKRQNPPLPSFLKRHIEFMERIVKGEGARTIPPVIFRQEMKRKKVVVAGKVFDLGLREYH